MMFVGVDGCRAGWFTVLLTDDNAWRVDVFPDIFSLWEKYRSARVILIDIPIGLLEKGPKERMCDKKARKLLGPRRASSIFPVPCRSAVYTKSYYKASKINEKMTGRGLSLQSWNIVSKIREVDMLLLSNETAKSKIRETHPEICFWAMAGYPMRYSKKKNEGLLERLQILKSIYSKTDDIIKHTLSNYTRSEVARDDILDALSAATVATMGEKRLFSIPGMPEFDLEGLRMEIVYYPFSTKFKTI